MIYMDHAATSWPKPPQVIRAMADFLERDGGNPGRSGHQLSIAAGRAVYDAREALAELLNAPDPLRVVFTHNATYAINFALYGLLQPGDRVIVSGMEHNAVMRPLRALERTGVQVAVVPCASDGSISLEGIASALGEPARLVVINHASNVVGTIAPIARIAQAAHARGVPLLVDAAQTAGVLPIDMQAMGIDLLAFTGHKGLQGPPGTGGLVFGAAFDPASLQPIIRGGTGSQSELEEQPTILPDKLESGTPNGVGIAGLSAGIAHITTCGVGAIREREIELAGRLVDGLSAIRGVTVYGPTDPTKRTAVISCRVAALHVSDVALRLDEGYGVLCRVGLHCAPAAHRTLGTFPEGTVRLAPGPDATFDEIDTVVHAIERLAREGARAAFESRAAQ